MKKIHYFLLVVLISGCASKSTEGVSLARFEGGKVTEKDYLRRLEAMPEEARSFVRGHKKEFLEDIVAEHFLLKEAKRRGIQKDPEVQQLLEAAQRKIIISRLVQKEIDDKVSLTDEEVEKYYTNHQDEFMTSMTLRASHILVKTGEEALLIKTQLEGGGDFEELARQNSLDATAIRGGDLGFFQRGRFVPEFEDAVFTMKKGELKGPVKSQFGYHLIKLTDRLEPTLRQFRDVKDFVRQRLLAEKRSRAFRELVTKLKGNTRVDIDEKKLDKIEVS